MAYSEDFRLKVLSFIDRGETEAAVAQRFAIGVRTVRRLKQQRRRTGNVTSQKTGPKKPMKITAADDQLMHEQIRRKPGITARELSSMLSVHVSISTICRRLINLGLSLKKSR